MTNRSMLPGRGMAELSAKPRRISPGPPRRCIHVQSGLILPTMSRSGVIAEKGSCYRTFWLEALFHYSDAEHRRMRTNVPLGVMERAAFLRTYHAESHRRRIINLRAQSPSHQDNPRELSYAPNAWPGAGGAAAAARRQQHHRCRLRQGRRRQDHARG